MPILGVGTDIVETDRIRDVMEREESFAKRIFTQAELDYSLGKQSKYLHLAARFAAKEAVAKALGRSFSWHDVEVINNALGKPEIKLYGQAKGMAGNAKVHLSVSHTKHYASAVAIVEE
ncbi:MAG: holo-ACP synthase [Armatimonadota bacterium]|nr:holo-ACP synthase [bacterium]